MTSQRSHQDFDLEVDLGWGDFVAGDPKLVVAVRCQRCFKFLPFKNS